MDSKDWIFYLVSLYIVIVSVVGLYYKNMKQNLIVPSKILSTIALFFTIYVVSFRLARRTDDIFELFKNVLLLPIAFIISILLAIIITFFISFKEKTKDDKTKDDKAKDDKAKDDKAKDDETKDDKTVVDEIKSLTIWWILGGIMCFSVLVAVAYLVKNYWGRMDLWAQIMSIILMIGLILGPTLGYWYWMTTQPIEPIASKIFDVVYPQPTSRTLQLAELKKLLKNLGDFKMDNECKMNDQTDCNYLYNQYIASNGDGDILEKLLYQLVDLKTKDGDQDKTGLINQAIYIIYQLLQCKISLDYKTSVYRFGTWEWWSQNIYMDSPIDDPTQRFIWGISILVCGLFLFYNLYIYADNSEKIFNEDFETNRYWIIAGILLTISQIVLIWLLIIGNLTSEESDKIDKPVSKEFQKYETSLPETNDPQRKNDLEKDYKTDPMLKKEKTGLIGLFSYLGVIVSAIVMSYVGGDSWWGRGNKIFAISAIIALVLSFNSYYMILVPQLVIIGIILQKYILSTDLMDNIPFTVMKGIILVVVLFASFYDTTYRIKDKEAELKDPDTGIKEAKSSDIITDVSGAYNKPVWYMFGILVALLIQNGAESFTGATDNYKDPNQWSLILMPMARYIIEFIAKGKVPYDTVSVTNKF